MPIKVDASIFDKTVAKKLGELNNQEVLLTKLEEYKRKEW